MKAPITVDVQNESELDLVISVDVDGSIRPEDFGRTDATLQPPYFVTVRIRRREEDET